MGSTLLVAIHRSIKIIILSCLSVATGEKIEYFTSDQIYEGESQEHHLSFTQHIHPISIYIFSISLVGPDFLQKKSDGTYETIEMESEKAAVNCYTKPAMPSGKMISFFRCSLNYFLSKKCSKVHCCMIRG